MLGDSRTQYVFQFGVEVDWENQDFLGKYKHPAVKVKLVFKMQESGSTTEHWLEFLKSEHYKPEEFHEHIVLMIGGNDIQRYAYKWKGF